VPLLRGLAWTFDGHRDLADWPAAAAAALWSFIGHFEHLQSIWQAGGWAGDPPWMDEVAPLAESVQALDPDQRTALLATLGEHADTVRQVFGGDRESPA
jgi:hypothetical protein